MARIPFNLPYTTGQEFHYLQQAIDAGHLSGRGPFDHRCTEWLERRTGAAKALLTFSCTSALEMAALLAGVGEGDEVIMPSFTFVSTANAVAMRGAVPVFVDVRADTLNMDERRVEAAVNERTRAILPVHYAGVGCEMDDICSLASAHGLTVIEDAAQGLMSTYRGSPLGTDGALGCISFHETKNVHCGEGGALLVNDPEMVERAEIVQEKGTNRTQFARGEVDKYTWVEIGSSFLTSDFNAAFLWAQLEHADEITARRLAIWGSYHERFEDLERRGQARRPVVPAHCEHNAHMYYLLLPSRDARDAFIRRLAERDIQAVFHYVPLHSSPAGRRLGRAEGDLPVTDDISERLVRLPLWPGMTDALVSFVAEEAAVAAELASRAAPRADGAGRAALHDDVVSDVAHDDGAGGDDHVPADGHPGAHHGADADQRLGADTAVAPQGHARGQVHGGAEDVVVRDDRSVVDDARVAEAGGGVDDGSGLDDAPGAEAGGGRDVRPRVNGAGQGEARGPGTVP